eukprot:1112629-Prymnesium_polylepis.1
MNNPGHLPLRYESHAACWSVDLRESCVLFGDVLRASLRFGRRPRANGQKARASPKRRHTQKALGAGTGVPEPAVKASRLTHGTGSRRTQIMPGALHADTAAAPLRRTVRPTRSTAPPQRASPRSPAVDA